MGFLLDSRAALLRQFYHHLGTEATDDSLTEHDSETLEQAHRYLQFGLWNAQAYLVDLGLGERWRAVSAALDTWQGADTTDGGRYLAMNDAGAFFTRFLKMAGDDENSALREPNGTRWGREIDERQRFDVRGNYWYTLGDDQLWVARGAEPPSTLVADYYQRHAILEAVTAIDFPEDLTPLITAEAAVLALGDAWVPIGPEQKAEIRASQSMWRKTAAKRKRTRTPKRMRARQTYGTHFWRR